MLEDNMQSIGSVWDDLFGICNPYLIYNIYCQAKMCPFCVFVSNVMNHLLL